MNRSFKTFSFIAMLFLGNFIFAQEEVFSDEANVDDLGDVSDAFKDNFFNALAAKAIGNHDKAIQYLEACEKLEPENGAVQFELGKNYLMSDAFAKAEQKITRAIEIAGETEWLLETLYDVYDKQKQYDKSLNVLEKLVKINENYEELLPYQYARANNNKEALAIIEKLDRRLGEEERRTQLKEQIQARLDINEARDGNIEDLERAIASNPKDEKAYVNLIYLYSKKNNTEKVQEVAEALEKNLPESDKAQLALYKIYLENGKTSKGIKSMQKIFESAQFDIETKINVLNDYIQSGGADLDDEEIQHAIDDFADQVEDVNAFSALGDYYLKRKEAARAVSFYEKGLELDDKNYDLIKKVALLSIDIKDYKKTLEVTGRALEIFPAQALLYLLSGVAHNHLNEPDKAISQLETGLSFLLDEPKLESDMYQQLAWSYDQKNETTKAATMRSKVIALSKKT
ncbi:tetratricopeptide repeat protein [Nonlabens sp.]|uniref:tetratricopeptide repeat protein n=1 Tax=Nonlabens sp. TaxID=1888209 RepID=UPI0025F923FB|nr:tetratricopeptide repeat protein [Nonlabens sp.]